VPFELQNNVQLHFFPKLSDIGYSNAYLEGSQASPIFIFVKEIDK